MSCYVTWQLLHTMFHRSTVYMAFLTFIADGDHDVSGATYGAESDHDYRHACTQIILYGHACMPHWHRVPQEGLHVISLSLVGRLLRELSVLLGIWASV